MKLLFPAFFIGVFLFASCAKEEVITFDDQISVAQDFKVDAATGDTIYRFYMPNGFTPDGNGINDLYQPYGSGFDYTRYEMRITSRENNFIFSTTNANKAWDGRMQGSSERCANGVYTVDVSVDDTTHEHHHYIYDAVLFR